MAIFLPSSHDFASPKESWGEGALSRRRHIDFYLHHQLGDKRQKAQNFDIGNTEIPASAFAYEWRLES